MVAHEAVAVEIEFELFFGGYEIFEEFLVVCLGEEDLLAVVAAGSYVI